MNRRFLVEFVGSVDVVHIGLYVWLLAGKIWVAGWGSIPLPQTDSTWIRAGWLAVGFGAPIMVFAAYAAIRWGSGRAKYRAFWVRLGADISQVCIMALFTANLLSHAYADPGTDQDHHVFTAFFMGALLSFLAAMIVRDVLTITVTERLATKIRREASR